MLIAIHSITLLALAVTVFRLVRQVRRVEQLTYTLARQSEDQATLINQQAQLIQRITHQLRR